MHLVLKKVGDPLEPAKSGNVAIPAEREPSASRASSAFGSKLHRARKTLSQLAMVTLLFSWVACHAQ